MWPKCLLLVFFVVSGALCHRRFSKFGFYRVGYNGNFTNADELQEMGVDFLGKDKVLTFKKGDLGIFRDEDLGVMKNLKVLHMTKMNINSLEPGCLSKHKDLEVVNLSKNKIKKIKVGVFSGLKISTLLLHRNHIEAIEVGSFSDMPNLDTIKLNSNRLREWDPNWFKNVPYLRQIYARRNSIEFLPSRAFDFGSQISGMDLFFSKNDMLEIQPNAFQGLKSLRFLFLDRNSLGVLDAGLFEPLDSIEKLVLKKNNITTITDTRIKNVKIAKLIIKKNPIKCLPDHFYSSITEVVPKKTKCDKKIRHNKKRKQKHQQ